ncbi:uncharacterized protein [Amphiura filiformis]|uniref:uncharacterized protein n=1 Tax=Amphiura filiformis TaxID=82378 RepID=UPI003B20EE7D
MDIIRMIRNYLYLTLFLLVESSNYKLTTGQAAQNEIAPSVEVSFADNPVIPGSEAILQCKVFGDVQKDRVGISRYTDNGVNTVVYRNGNLLQDAREHFSIDILPGASDGSTSYHVSIAPVDRITDGGLYTCYALDYDGRVVAIATTRLQVTPDHLLPECISSDGGTRYTVDTEITFACTALDATATAQWIREGQIDLPMSQNMSRDRDSNTVTTTLSQTFSISDQGASFTCRILNDDQSVIPGRKCSIGPITVQPSNGTVAVAKIGDLSVTSFALVVTFACIFLIACVVLIIFCYTKGVFTRSSAMSRGRNSSKSYSFQGRLGSFADSTLTRDGTVTGGRETYNPTRPAPAPPTTVVNGDARRTSDERPVSSGLSAAEAALMMAVVGMNTVERNSGTRSSDDIIYANTDEIGMHPLTTITEENNVHPNGGISNPRYETEIPSPKPAALRGPPSPVVYSNTNELPSVSSSTSNIREPRSPVQKDQPKPFVLPNLTNNAFALKPVPLTKPKTREPPLKSVLLFNQASNSSEHVVPNERPVPIPKVPGNISAKPTPLPKVASPDRLKPVPLHKVETRDPPKPIPRPKPTKQAPTNPSRPVPPVKPTSKVPASQQRPVPPVKPVNDSSVNDGSAAAALRPPPPPAKPKYEITEDGPPKPPTPDYTTAQKRPPPPPKKPSFDDEDRKKSPPPLAPPKPNYDISENRPSPPPKPLPGNKNVVANNRPPPPPVKPKYEI